jgi:hypothetical protein
MEVLERPVYTDLSEEMEAFVERLEHQKGGSFLEAEIEALEAYDEFSQTKLFYNRRHEIYREQSSLAIERLDEIEERTGRTIEGRDELEAFLEAMGRLQELDLKEDVQETTKRKLKV